MNIRAGWLYAGALAIAACASLAIAQPPKTDPIGALIKDRVPGTPETPLVDRLSAMPVEQRDTFETYLIDLLKASCPPGVASTEPAAIALKAQPVPLQAINPFRKTLGELTYVGGFQLTSTDKRFGGLSGLDFLANGNLLAVSDVGDFFWIDLGKDGVTPATARVAPMLGAKGVAFASKVDGDSEGLAVIDDIALVSFERNHRVLAYDLSKCGASARGAPIVFGGHGQKMADVFKAAKLKVGENSGGEALAVTPDWFMFSGLETKAGSSSPLSARPIEAAPDYNLRIGKGAPEFVGLDLVPAGADGQDVRAFSLHRSAGGIGGPTVVIEETYLARVLDQTNLPRNRIDGIQARSHDRFEVKSSRTLAEMNLLVTLDNFEGIAAQPLPDGRVRLFIVSDDNFSPMQRTLLMVFDVAKR